ncbi:hypothetical protein Cgig2_013680 [Carnegiea gigantea]|uniref:Uncharacterized protein n=1 Tax=Carnegiea gigantea TaxID=171969 RepID=A0A9Q1KE35_9CARY|nr:hypothetical protein Cgig2_013680 [Carnegiea gigantea]
MQGFKTRPFRAGTAELTRIFTLAFRVWAKTRGAERVTVERPFHPYRNGERTIGLGQKRQFSEKIYDSFGFRIKQEDQAPLEVLEHSSNPESLKRNREKPAFAQPRIVEEEQKERAVAKQIERETNRGTERETNRERSFLSLAEKEPKKCRA